MNEIIASECGICLSEPATHEWKRHLPGLLTISVGADCADRLRRQADDRSHEPGDYVRLAGLYWTLAGEVWQFGDDRLWFRTPLILRRHHLAPEMPSVADEPPAPVTRMMLRPVDSPSPRSRARTGARGRTPSSGAAKPRPRPRPRSRVR